MSESRPHAPTRKSNPVRAARRNYVIMCGACTLAMAALLTTVVVIAY